jgi:hypothetical protein
LAELNEGPRMSRAFRFFIWFYYRAALFKTSLFFCRHVECLPQMHRGEQLRVTGTALQRPSLKLSSTPALKKFLPNNRFACPTRAARASLLWRM